MIRTRLRRRCRGSRASRYRLMPAFGKSRSSAHCRFPCSRYGLEGGLIGGGGWRQEWSGRRSSSASPTQTTHRGRHSRGVELFVEASLWAVLFINFGLLVTVVAHFVYDLVLFGLFAASGSSVEYRVTAAIIVLALLSPALAVLWRLARQRGFTTAPEEARFGAWTPIADEEPKRL